MTVNIKRYLATLGVKGLRLFSPEIAHLIGMRFLKSKTLGSMFFPDLKDISSEVLPDILPMLKVTVPGLGELPQPIGLAAGFDKNCDCPEAFPRLGFSFLEVGTITPKPQSGNPKPRIFRIPTERAIINRMGFNNDGAAQIAKRLQAKIPLLQGIPIGVNVGKNKVTPAEKSIEDYMVVIEAFKHLATFFVVNISSPNTPGLRDLATPFFIRELRAASSNIKTPIWIKLDPDMSKPKLQSMIQAILEAKFQGAVLTNTHRVEWPEGGGLSGHPLSVLSTTCLEWAWEVHKGRLPIIATGGILSGIDVFQKMARGALAVELYTALIYHGPWVIYNLLLELVAELNLRSIRNLSDVVGCHYL